jgi:hypothetical protein
MLKKSASGVLASLRGSTYRTEYASPLRVLRPCWTAFLSILRRHSPLVPEVHTIKVQLCQYGFSGACWPRCVMLLQLISVLGALMVLSAYGLIQGGVCVS